MAHKKRRGDTDGSDLRPANTKGKVNYTDFKFARIEMSSEEKDEFRKLLASGEFETLDLDGWLRQGYKISVVSDGRGEGALATLSGQHRDMLNGGLLLTGRGSTVAVALAVLDYKNNYLAGEDGWLAAQDRRGGGYQDID